VALLSARFVEDLGITPRIAMLSFSNFGSAGIRRRQGPAGGGAGEGADPGAGGGRGDAGRHGGERQILLTGTYPFSDLKEPANVLIFPNLAAANVSYKLLAQLGGPRSSARPPGHGRPVHILQRGSTAQDVVNLPPSHR
jgi:malate dehydrogenase (oxaloacetate-decarboxylating)(NADP+)